MKPVLQLVVLFTVIASSVADEDLDEKIWTTCSGNTSCSCGNGIDGVVMCSDGYILIQPCYCMYYDHQEKGALVGNCMQTCYYVHSGNNGNYHYPIKQYSAQNATTFNYQACNSLTSSTVSFRPTHREGRFCGQCAEGYGLAVYSYHYTSCIPCSDYSFKNWLKYFAVALLPLTVFYFILVVFRINITASRLNGIVFVLQCVGSPLQLRIMDGYFSSVATGVIYHYPKRFKPLIGASVVMGILGLVNLDFFRTLYPYFCLHPKLTILHVISLDIIVALYPFVLIFLTYILVTLYDNSYRCIVLAWKPFKWCLNRYQRNFNIRTSLIEVFASFILLANVKLLGIILDLLAATRAYNVHGKLVGTFLYYDANIEYFGPEHLPFALLALVVGLLFVLLPFLLLVTYPCTLFQRFLNCCGCRCRLLHVLMDAFQGSYKTTPCDLRCFSAYYLLLRFLVVFFMEYFASIFLVPAIGFLIVAGALVFAAFQPYKSSIHNKLDIVAMLFLALFYMGYTSDIVASYLDLHWLVAAQIFFIGSVAAMVIFYLILLPFNILKIMAQSMIRCLRKTKVSDRSPEVSEVFDRDFGRAKPPANMCTPLLTSAADNIKMYS